MSPIRTYTLTYALCLSITSEGFGQSYVRRNNWTFPKRLGDYTPHCLAHRDNARSGWNRVKENWVREGLVSFYSQALRYPWIMFYNMEDDIYPYSIMYCNDVMYPGWLLTRMLFRYFFGTSVQVGNFSGIVSTNYLAYGIRVVKKVAKFPTDSWLTANFPSSREAKMSSRLFPTFCWR